MSFGIIVIHLAFIATKQVCLNNCTRYTSAACWMAMIAMVCQWRSIFKSLAIFLTNLCSGSFLIMSSVLFWYLLISWRALSTGLLFLFLGACWPLGTIPPPNMWLDLKLGWPALLWLPVFCHAEWPVWQFYVKLSLVDGTEFPLGFACLVGAVASGNPPWNFFFSVSPLDGTLWAIGTNPTALSTTKALAAVNAFIKHLTHFSSPFWILFYHVQIRCRPQVTQLSLHYQQRGESWSPIHDNYQG